MVFDTADEARAAFPEEDNRPEVSETAGERENDTESIEAAKEKRPAQRPSGVKGKGRGKKRGTGGKRKRRSGRKKKKTAAERVLTSWITTIVLSTLIIAMIAVGVTRVAKANRFEKMKAVVCVDNFYEGTSVEGINVSGMTMDEALDYWNGNIEGEYANATVRLDNGIELSAADMGYSSDYIDVLYDVWNAERSGPIDERYYAILSHEGSRADHPVHRAYYDDATVRAFVDELAASIDTEPEDARLLSFNPSTYQFEYQDEVVGKRLDREQLVTDIETALRNGGGTVTLKIDTIQPAITRENVSANYGMISYAVTNASSSSSNRLSNIALALSIINGTAIEPGKTFSFNAVVGERTSAAGFKKAPAYYAGTVKEEIGGGICQVSTTVFNAAVKADLKIKERHAHSMTVSYVDPGKDAAVDWGNKDLKFTNTSTDTVYICCYLTDDKRVRVGIFGKLLSDGRSVVVETKKTGDIDYKTDYQLNFSMGSGEMKVAQKGKKGAKATTYKITLDASGAEIGREELFKSTYSPQNEIVEYGQ